MNEPYEGHYSKSVQEQAFVYGIGIGILFLIVAAILFGLEKITIAIVFLLVAILAFAIGASNRPSTYTASDGLEILIFRDESEVLYNVAKEQQRHAREKLQTEREDKYEQRREEKRR